MAGANWSLGYLELILQKEYSYYLEMESEEDVLCGTQSPLSAVSEC